MTLYVSPEMYRKFKDEILGYSNSRQRYEPGKGLRGLTDAEIAEKLGIAVEQATEIRCIAEIDSVEIARFFEADSWKQERFERSKISADQLD